MAFKRAPQGSSQKRPPATHGQRGGQEWVAPPTHMDNEEKALILELYFKKKRNYQQIAELMGRNIKSIRTFIVKHHPTTAIAESLLRAGAATLAQKVLEKADVDQAIEVLSRPNIGVLAPINKVKDGPQIFISVGQESVGAIGSREVGLLEAGSGSTLDGEDRHVAEKDDEEGIQAPRNTAKRRGKGQQYAKQEDLGPQPSEGGSAAQPASPDDARGGRGHLAASTSPHAYVKKGPPEPESRPVARGIHLRYDIVEPEGDAS